MNLFKSQVIYFLMTIVLPFAASTEEKPIAILPPAEAACAIPDVFSDLAYEDLRVKLQNTLRDQNKSLILLDFKGLQAQVDVLVSHLINEDNFDAGELREILKKNLAYLEQLEKLIAKAKDSAKLIKDTHVVPMASLTSLKAESDNCLGIASPYTNSYKTLSQLNKDFNEILVMSPEKIAAEKQTVKKLLGQIDDKKFNAQILTEHFNFLQTHINTVTQTFQFNADQLQIATTR